MKPETSPDKRCVLAVDPGRTYGIAIVSFDNKVIYREEMKFTGQKDFLQMLRSMVFNYQPSAIAHGTPVRYPAVIAFQSKMIGIIDLVAEEANIATVPCVDNTCKKVVLGSGKAEKPAIMQRYGEESEHVADCLMFAEYFLSFQDKEL